jgi:hypothetical protein
MNMVNVMYRVDNVISTSVRKLVNSDIRFIFAYNPKSGITGDLHRGVLEQVTHQLMQPMQLNLILPNPEEK